MSNKVKEFTINLKCNEAFYRALVLMLRHAKYIGNIGASRVLAIYFDGDGSDRIKELDISDTVKERRDGILELASHIHISSNGFYLDTDKVFNG